MAFFDFAAAFPSVAHAWLFAVLTASGAPEWFINYVSALYAGNVTCHMNSHGKTFLFSILAGVLQGCPMSATLFIFAINPFLLHFEEILEKDKLGIVRACADDIGISLHDFRSLANVSIVFECAKRLANLNLKPPKCHIVPLNCPSSDSGQPDYSLITKWLEVHIPNWKTFQICRAAKYLGFFLGPGAGANQWTLPIKKWKDRSRDIANSHMRCVC